MDNDQWLSKIKSKHNEVVAAREAKRHGHYNYCPASYEMFAKCVCSQSELIDKHAKLCWELDALLASIPERR
jgi:hypothetical protein